MKNLIKIASLAVVAVVAVSCIREEASTPSVSLPEAEVGFLLPEDVTRTSLDPDGRTTRWAPGDKLAVWARGVDGSYAFENTQFMLHHYSEEFSKAYFASTIAPMSDGEYTYMLSYPMPNSVNGTLATYTIPTTQTGEYDGRYDIMLAEPVVEGALTAESKVELNTIMRHKMHGIKITVPEKASNFDSKVYRLEITFPTAVVGDMTIDVSDPAVAPTYANTSNTVVVESATGIDVGSDIWIFVLPGQITGDVSYSIRGDKQRSEVATYPIDRNMRSGHVTPIRMAMPPFAKYTAFNFSVGENYLGEDFNFFTLYDSNGTNMGTFYRNAENRYTFAYEGEFDVAPYNNSNWKLVFDTDNAIVENSVNLGTLRAYYENDIAPVDIPYLMYEDFSQITSFSDGHDNPSTGWNSDTYNSSKLLDSYTSLLAGWSAGRIGASAGQSVRICCRLEGGLSVTSYYKGRVDTAPLAKIKSGKSVRLKVSFSYGANRKEYGTGSGNPTLTFGHTTQSGALAPSSEIENIVLSNSEVTSLSGSYSNTPYNAEFEIDNCTNATRLSWQSSTSRTSVIAGNGNYWIYLDNIKVQISK